VAISAQLTSGVVDNEKIATGSLMHFMAGFAYDLIFEHPPLAPVSLNLFWHTRGDYIYRVVKKGFAAYIEFLGNIRLKTFFEYLVIFFHPVCRLQLSGQFWRVTAFAHGGVGVFSP
jgi:hypothetical protein